MQKIYIKEDWLAAFLGLFLIAFIGIGFNPAIPGWGWKEGAAGLGLLLDKQQWSSLLPYLGLFTGLSAVTAFLQGKSWLNAALAMLLVFVLTVVAMWLAGNPTMKELNLEVVIFGLGIGLLIGNVVRVPQWLKEGLQTEFWVKTGVVMLGSSVIFGDVLKAGGLGLLQALVVVLVVWYFAFWLCKRMGIDEEMGLMVSSAVSICGVSAAIATAGAIKGDHKKLSYVISLVLVTAIPMMIFMPYVANWLGLSQQVTGAWLGGSIDTTGAVVASGTLVGDEALKISTIVKFSQNVLLGLAAFAISVYWSYRGAEKERERPTLSIIWQRFPKFVIGFIAASLLFSFVVSAEWASTVKPQVKNIQTWWFALAFTGIGIETRLKDFVQKGNQKPLYAFLGAQVFNVLLTLLIAWLLFA